VTALGIRDCNPLNLTWRPQDKWDGLATPPNVGRFCSFLTPQAAFRAYTKELQSYLAAGHDTVPKFIKTWSETDQDAYVVNVLRWGHFKALQVLTVEDALALFRAMCRQEDGSDPYPDSVIQEGIDMALGSTPAKSVAITPTTMVASAAAIGAYAADLLVGALHDFAHVDVTASRQIALAAIVTVLIHHFFPKGDQPQG
jgi:hypothetical protein